MSPLLLLYLGFIAFQIYMSLMLKDGAEPSQRLSVGDPEEKCCISKQGPKH